MKGDKINRRQIDRTRTVLEKRVEAVSQSVGKGKRLSDDQMFKLGRSMMEHLLAVGSVASW